MLRTIISPDGYQKSLVLSLILNLVEILSIMVLLLLHHRTPHLRLVKVTTHKNRTRSPPSDSGGQSPKDDKNKNNGLSAGAIIGLSVGSSVLFLIALLALVFCCIIRKRKRKEFTTGASAGSRPISADKGTCMKCACLRSSIETSSRLTFCSMMS